MPTQPIQNDATGPVWQDLLLDLLSRRLLIVMFFLFTAVGTYVALQLVTPQYESTAALLVKLGRENLQVPPTVGNGGVFSTGVRAEEINSEVGLLRSREVLEATIDRIGVDAFQGTPPEPTTLFQRIKAMVKDAVKAAKKQIHDWLVRANLTQDLSERDQLILGLESALTVERVRESDVIRLAIRLPNPTLAQHVLETLLDIFTERHVEVRRNEPMQQFFASQAQAHLDRIEAIEAEMEQLRAERNIGSVDQQRVRLVERLHITLSELANSQRELALLGEDNSAPPEQPVPTAAGVQIEPIKARMTELRIERVKLEQRFDADSRMVRVLDQELAQLQRTLSASLHADIIQLQSQADAIEREIVSLNSAETRLTHLERDLAMARENYADYQKRTEEARISEEMDLRRVLNVSVLDPPTRPAKPVSPNKLLIMALSIPLGLLVGIGIAMLLEYLNDTVRTHRDLARIRGLNYLGSFRLDPGTLPRRSIGARVMGRGSVVEKS